MKKGDEVYELREKLRIARGAVEMAIRIEKDEYVPSGYLKKLEKALADLGEK